MKLERVNKEGDDLSFPNNQHAQSLGLGVERFVGKYRDREGEREFQLRRGNGARLNGMNGFLKWVFGWTLHASSFSYGEFGKRLF